MDLGDGLPNVETFLIPVIIFLADCYYFKLLMVEYSLEFVCIDLLNISY